MNYANLIQNITENIKTNGSQAITAQVLQDVLVDMVGELGQSGALLGGVIDTSFVPDPTNDARVVYIAEGPGTYTNFNGLVVGAGEVAFFYFNGNAWAKSSVDVLEVVNNLNSTATDKALSAAMGKQIGDNISQLGQKVTDLDGQVNGSQSGEETIDATFTDGTYRQEQVDNSIVVIQDVNISLVTLDDVIPGSTYEIKLQSSINPSSGTLRASYFVFAKTDSVASIATTEIENYVTETDTTNHIYRIVIPPETTKFFTAVLTSWKTNFYAKRIIEATSGLVGRVNDLEDTVSGITEGENTITGKQIDGSSVTLAEESITPSFSDGEYRLQQLSGQIVTESMSSVSLIEIENVAPGEVYEIKLMQQISTSFYQSYFIFAKTTTEAAISNAEKGNYVTEIDTVNHIYRFIIPNDTTIFYSACLKDNKPDVWCKRITTTKVLEWLKIEGRNLAPTIFDTCIASVFSTIEKQNASLHLWDSIKRPLNLSGKTLVAFGDSITAGVSSPGLVTIQDSYIKLFCDFAGVSTFVNRAVSGSCLADADGVDNSIYDRVTGYTGDVDIIWIAGGTNDWNTGKEVGTFGGTDTKTTYGALKGICDYLQTNYPNAVVIFVTPIPYTKPASAYPNHIAPLDEYRSAIYDVATYYGYSVVSGLGLGMPRELGGWNNTMIADSDGCHPTARGHALYARSLAGKLL